MARPKGTGQFFDQVQHTLNGEAAVGSSRLADSSKPLILDSPARLTIETISDFAAQVRAALSEHTAVAIRFPATVELDITALQLFCSACKTAGAAGKSFTYHGPLPEALYRLAEASGSERHTSCAIDSSACFRKIGGSSLCPS
jgi:ABC-type transporter Mla MlaB component